MSLDPWARTSIDLMTGDDQLKIEDARHVVGRATTLMEGLLHNGTSTYSAFDRATLESAYEGLSGLWESLEERQDEWHDERAKRWTHIADGPRISFTSAREDGSGLTFSGECVLGERSMQLQWPGEDQPRHVDAGRPLDTVDAVLIEADRQVLRACGFS